MSRRSLRHPFGGGNFYPKPASGRSKPRHRSKARQPRIRPRRNVSVGSFVASPEDQPSRPLLRLQIVGVIVLVLFVVMVLRLWSLQVIDGKSYAAVVNANQIRTVSVDPPRGVIVDRHDTVLAGNTIETEIVLSRAEATQHPTVIGQVAALVNQTPKQIEAALADKQYSPYEPVPILQNAKPTTVQFLDTHPTEYPGVSVQHVSQRHYPQGSGTLATHVLGYVGAITATFLKAHPNQGYTQSTQVGKAGIEYQYEPYLRGVPGKQELEVDASGDVVGTLKQTAATQGDTVVLNITAGLQAAAQNALASDMTADKKTRDPSTGKLPAATNGAVVVMDAETGAVLALASNPTYSLDTWVGGISTAAYQNLSAGCQGSSGACPLNDYAIQGLYTPGSTFKLATATAALQTGLIGPETTINDTGTFTIKTTTCKTGGPGCSFKDNTASDAGRVNVSSALTKSDDYFFYTLGYRFYKTAGKYGADAIQKTANSYGFGQLTTVDLPDEAQGRVDSATEVKKLHQETPKNFPNTTWYVGNNVEMAFGQGGTVVTPIEEAQAYATFANGGTRYQPQVASAIVTPTGQIVKRFAPKVTGKVTLSPADHAAMAAGFAGVVNTPHGTAYQTFQQISKVPKTYPISGKTGTADVSKTTAKEPNAWFVGFGPTNTTHQYVVAVVVNQGGYGATAAAPAVANIFNYLYSNPVSSTPKVPTAAEQPSTTPPTTIPPIGTPPPTTTTTTAPGAPASPTTTTTTATTTTTPPKTGTGG
jgi:penicillin-binding protein 2